MKTRPSTHFPIRLPKWCLRKTTLLNNQMFLCAPLNLRTFFSFFLVQWQWFVKQELMASLELFCLNCLTHLIASFTSRGDSSVWDGAGSPPAATRSAFLGKVLGAATRAVSPARRRVPSGPWVLGPWGCQVPSPRASAPDLTQRWAYELRELCKETSKGTVPFKLVYLTHFRK